MGVGACGGGKLSMEASRKSKSAPVKSAPAKAQRKSLSFLDVLGVLWFLTCGWIHVALEGAWIAFHRDIEGAQGDLIGSLATFRSSFMHGIQGLEPLDAFKVVSKRVACCMWKDYAFADTRYFFSDTGTLGIEAITAIIVGPLCFLLAYAILYRASFRHALQIIVCSAHVYGTVLYFVTEFLDDFSHVDKNNVKLFWVYFVCTNCIWLVVPLLFLLQSVGALSSPFAKHSGAGVSSFITFLLFFPLLSMLAVVTFLAVIIIAGAAASGELDTL